MMGDVLHWLESLANQVPLEVFVVAGGLIEEIIAPIPSPLVNSLAGSIAAAQELGWGYLFWLCFLSSVAKTAGTWIFYVVGDKLEDAVVPRFGKYIGVTHEDLEHFGEHFKGGWKDDVILLVLRAIPVMPSTPISLVCGVLKINLRTYLVSTSAGFFLRNFFFMAIGFLGLDAADAITKHSGNVESILTVLMLGAIVLLLAWLYWKRGKVHPGTWLKKKH